MIENLSSGVQIVFQFQNLLVAFLGTGLGIIVGALPGLTATMGVALLVPITFAMDPITGLIMLSGIYCGGIYGGSVAAILVHAPGTPAAICTMQDGYELTRQGRAREALSVAILASFVGGIFSSLALLFFSPALASFALRFGPFEYFALCLFGMSIIASISADDPIKGIVSGIFGLMIATVGMDPYLGFPRYHFDSVQLFGGIELVPVLIGLFALPEAFRLLVRHRRKDGKTKEGSAVKELSGRLLPPVSELFKKTFAFVRSSIIGVLVGIVPAIGPVVAPFISYNEAKRFSKNPEKIGKGDIEGIISAEAANNGVTGASLIPLITLGIPGSAVAAVFLGGLTIHGLRPGPMLFQGNPEVVYGLFVGFFVVNITMLILGLSASKFFARVTAVPDVFLATFIILFSLLGSFAIRNTFFDIWVVILFGFLGFLLAALKFPPGPIVLGLVLGPLLEDNLVRSIILSRGEIAPFFHSPIANIFYVLTLMSLIYSLVTMRRGKKEDTS